ncbi:MAG: hypothetical protein J6B77_08765, partial [Clostridia bacterium]|nr:hypothetical protein [Clostridia bacterium]
KLNAQKNDPLYDELYRNQLVTYGAPGHVAWNWNLMLRIGTVGMRERCLSGLRRHEGDPEAEQFYSGVMIMLDALEAWNEKHVRRLIEMGKTEEAEICRRVPKYPARSFREAVQSFFIQFITVMKEEPDGGNSPGRLDYYLWPYLENDLKRGVCTEAEAEELIEELFVRIDERLYHRDGWVESVVVGGSHPNGTSAVNPLSHIMIKAYMKYDITHPAVYVRIPRNPPEDFLDLVTSYMINGRNRAQLLCDEAIVGALIKNGVSESDAADYFCGGCMEVGVQGRTSDFLFTGYQNIAKLLELCMTGGCCLKTKKPLLYFKTKPLSECDSFEEFYSVFIEEAQRVLTENLKYQDKLSEYVAHMRPAYLLSSMIEDCLTKGRNMHGGGARYHDYGASLVGIPNAADALIAIKKAVFDDGICTAEELMKALSDDFVGHEALRAKLLALPKYGQENAEADEMAARLVTDMSRIYSSYVNRFGGNGKLVLLTFIWAPTAGAILGASADGRRAGAAIAHSVTPQCASMTKGITVAINSCTSLPFELFSGGASTMWDLDPSIVTPGIVKSLFMTFFEQGGQIFQGNVTDVEELKKARREPEEYRHVIVRVGGYSARFVNLSKDLQNEIITRLRHKG